MQGGTSVRKSLVGRRKRQSNEKHCVAPGQTVDQHAPVHQSPFPCPTLHHPMSDPEWLDEITSVQLQNLRFGWVVVLT